jgi:hypothetical protein
VHTDELDQVFNSEVGERLDAIFSDAVLDLHFVGDFPQLLFVFAEVLCYLINGGDAQAATASTTRSRRSQK